MKGFKTRISTDRNLNNITGTSSFITVTVSPVTPVITVKFKYRQPEKQITQAGRERDIH